MMKSFDTSDGARLNYTDTGNGPVLVLLPGWSQSAAMFHHQISHFSQTHRVIAIDFRGQGSSPDVAYGHRIYRYAMDVHELLAAAGVTRASILGWSMGASVLWALIDLFGTANIDRLIFLDEPASVARQPGMDDEAAANAGALFDMATMASIAEQIAGADGHAVRGAFLDGMITKGIPSDLKAFLLKENLRAAGKEIAAIFVNHCSIDWSDVFAKVDRPTLIIGGRVSHVGFRSQEWIHAQVKGSVLRVFEESEGGAHFPFIESPATFNATLEQFLSGE